MQYPGHARMVGLLLLAGCADGGSSTAGLPNDAPVEKPASPDGAGMADAIVDTTDTLRGAVPDVLPAAEDAMTTLPDTAPDTVSIVADTSPSVTDTVPDLSLLDIFWWDGNAAEAAQARDADRIDGIGTRDTTMPEVASCPGICNSATPSYPTVDTGGGVGNVTMYTTEASDGGACNYGTTGVSYFAAINVNVTPGDGKGQWNGGRICGQCVEVTALTSQGPKSVVARIMDRCPDVYCGIDLGGQAPAAIMLDDFGRYDGSWRFVSCAGHSEVSDGSPSLFVVAGSSAWWSRVQVRNPPWAVADMAWKDPAGGVSGSFPFATDPENTYEVPAEVLQSTAAILLVTVTYGDGSMAKMQVSPSQLATPNTSYPLE